MVKLTVLSRDVLYCAVVPPGGVNYFLMTFELQVCLVTAHKGCRNYKTNAPPCPLIKKEKIAVPRQSC